MSFRNLQATTDKSTKLNGNKMNFVYQYTLHSCIEHDIGIFTDSTH